MASISKIQIESGTFDIKDETARNGVATNNQNIATLQNNLNTFENTTNESLTTLQNNLNTFENTTNENLNNKENKLTELIIFGDSWSDPNVEDAIWGNLIGNLLNLNVTNYAVSGSFMHNEGETSLHNQVTQFINSSIDKNKIKYIVILGGINDYRHNATAELTASAIITEIETLHNASSNAKIIFVSNCQYPYTLNQGVFFDELHMRIRQSSMIATWNMFNNLGKALYNSENYFHLTKTGQKYMLSNIICMLTGGEIQYYTDNVEIDNTDAFIEYGTQRTGNVLFMTFQMYAKKAQKSFTFNVPNGLPNLSYSGSVFTGGVTYDYGRFVVKVNERSIIVAFENNTEADTYYNGNFIFSLRNSLPR